jgi:carbon monoxide dehydrogenase subunit G
MKLEQSFEVDAPLERVWEALIDVERVAPCLPGAAVTGRNDDGTYNGTFTIKIGPTTASYTGKLEMRDIDESVHTATMHAQGSDKRGQGGATATIVSNLSAADAGTRVQVVTDYHITGRLARFGRGGMIEDISERLLREFAGRLQSSLAGGGAAAGAGAAAGGGAAAGAAVGGAAAGDETPPPEAGKAGPYAAAPPEGLPVDAGEGAPGTADAAPAHDDESPTAVHEVVRPASAEEASATAADEPAEEPPPPPTEVAAVAAPPGPEAETAPAGEPEAPVSPAPASPEPPAPEPVTPEPGSGEPAPPEPPAPPAEPEASTPPGPPAAAAPPPPPPPPPHAAPPPPNEPLDAGSLVGGAVVDRVKRNPKPLIAVAGGLVLLRLIRRRR